jgi:membrane protein implicated in regulation of membrane protease activity
MLAKATAPAVLVFVFPLAVMLADADAPAVLAPSPKVWMGALVWIMILRVLRVYYGRKLLHKTVKWLAKRSKLRHHLQNYKAILELF